MKIYKKSSFIIIIIIFLNGLLMCANPGGSSKGGSNPPLEDKPVNLLKNGDFSNDTSNWTLWMNSEANASMAVKNNELKITITNQGPAGEFWHIGLSQRNFAIEYGKTYKLSFMARTDNITSISSVIQLGENPYTCYSGSCKTFNLTSVMTEYSYTFIMSYTTDNNSDLEFFLSGMGIGNVFFDNIVLKKEKNSIDSTTCNPNASDEAKAVLRYIATLSDSTNSKAIVGQNCYHGDEITASNPLDGYNKMIVDLYNQTGKWVSLAGIDYEYVKIFTPLQLSAANQSLIDHWNKGGLITITWSPQNPWENDESDIVNNPGTWDGLSSPQCSDPVVLAKIKLKDLIDPSKPVYQIWRKKLNRIADALNELQNAGVVVLWRPMQEMNGIWMWWGMRSHPNDPSDYINLYRDMYNYFTYVKHLNNLLWVYSPNFGGDLSSSWNRPVDWAYPGDQYVDIIAGTSYNDLLSIDDYNIYITMGNPRKPLGMGEWGPQIGGPLAQSGTLDVANYINNIRTKYPRIAYWVSWHSYPNECWSIISNQNYNTLMNDTDVITIDKLNLEIK